MRRISIQTIIIALSFLVSSTNIYAQHSELFHSNGEHVRYDNPKGGVYLMLTTDDKVQSAHKEDPEEVVHLIITFKDQLLHN
jgi:hypothetical protein